MTKGRCAFDHEAIVYMRRTLENYCSRSSLLVTFRNKTVDKRVQVMSEVRYCNPKRVLIYFYNFKAFSVLNSLARGLPTS